MGIESNNLICHLGPNRLTYTRSYPILSTLTRHVHIQLVRPNLLELLLIRPYRTGVDVL